MTRNITKLTLSIAATLILAAGAQAADNWIRLASRPGCKVTMDGTSSIHDWTVEGAIIRGSFEVEPEFMTDKTLKSVKSLTTKEVNPKAELAIPIRSLKSGKQKMDEIMIEAMKGAEHKDIVYKLKEMVLKGDVAASGAAKFDTKGDLTVAGVTKPCEMEIALERVDATKVKFTGEKKLKMTDFGIAPPSPEIPGMAAIKTGDDITIKFEWLLAPAPAAK
jgi:polyisoprenoid-binding protein YceI